MFWEIELVDTMNLEMEAESDRFSVQDRSIEEKKTMSQEETTPTLTRIGRHQPVPEELAPF